MTTRNMLKHLLLEKVLVSLRPISRLPLLCIWTLHSLTPRWIFPSIFIRRNHNREFPMVPPLPQRLRHRSLQSLLIDMRTEGSMPIGETLSSESSIAAFCRRRGISNRPPTLAAVTNEAQSTTSSPIIGTSRRALLLATDIAGVPCFPDMEGELRASSHCSPPASPVIDMSAYDLPLPVFPALSIPTSPVATGAILDMADLDSQPVSILGRRPAPPDCNIFPIFDKRVRHS